MDNNYTCTMRGYYIIHVQHNNTIDLDTFGVKLIFGSGL